MGSDDKPLVWLHGAVKSPPFSLLARIQAGELLRRIQKGESLSFPDSRPMPGIDTDALLIVEVFRKTTQQTPQHVIDVCKQRLKRYDESAREPDDG
ncbi:MAG TPA: hypothetical protein VFX98_09065 [Longimicrobiaceae bacterium]|nr:hypothetical protein [Longimicrobiaceae bacterium]